MAIDRLHQTIRQRSGEGDAKLYITDPPTFLEQTPDAYYRLISANSSPGRGIDPGIFIHLNKSVLLQRTSLDLDLQDFLIAQVLWDLKVDMPELSGLTSTTVGEIEAGGTIFRINPWVDVNRPGSNGRLIQEYRASSQTKNKIGVLATVRRMVTFLNYSR